MSRRRVVVSSSEEEEDYVGREPPSVRRTKQVALKGPTQASKSRKRALESSSEEEASASSGSSDDSDVVVRKPPPPPLDDEFDDDLSDGSDGITDSEGEEDGEGFSHFAMDMLLDQERERREIVLSKRVARQSQSGSGGVRVYSVACLCRVSMSCVTPGGPSPGRATSLTMLGSHGVTSVASVPLTGAFEQHAKYLLYSLADPNFPRTMERSVYCDIQRVNQSKVEGSMDLSRARLMAAAVWKEDIKDAINDRPWLSMGPLVGTTRMEREEVRCALCHRLSQDGMRSMFSRGPVYDSSRLLSLTSSLWLNGLPSPDETEPAPFEFTAGHLCAWKIRLYSHVTHFKFKLLLRISKFLETHAASEGDFCSVETALKLTESPKWAALVREEFTKYEKMLHMAEVVYTHTGSGGGARRTEVPRELMDPSYNWKVPSFKKVSFVQFQPHKMEALPLSQSSSKGRKGGEDPRVMSCVESSGVLEARDPGTAAVSYYHKCGDSSASDEAYESEEDRVLGGDGESDEWDEEEDEEAVVREEDEEGAEEEGEDEEEDVVAAPTPPLKAVKTLKVPLPAFDDEDDVAPSPPMPVKTSKLLSPAFDDEDDAPTPSRKAKRNPAIVLSSESEEEEAEQEEEEEELVEIVPKGTPPASRRLSDESVPPKPSVGSSRRRIVVSEDEDEEEKGANRKEREAPATRSTSSARRRVIDEVCAPPTPNKAKGGKRRTVVSSSDEEDVLF